MQGLNLLPWREQLREERKRQFIFVLGSSVVLALLIVVFIHTLIARRMEQQRSINKGLQEQIHILDRQLLEIKNLKQKKTEIINRLQLIHKLQSSRPLTVKIYDELVRVVPQGVYLDSVKREGNKLILKGQATSNTRVSELMRNIQKSKWFTSPILSEIKTIGEDASYQREFTLWLTIIEQRSLPLKDNGS